MRKIAQKDLISNVELDCFSNKRVLVIGAGGTGSHILNILATLPLQRLSIIDDDMVEENNLLRMDLYIDKNAKISKVESLKNQLSNLFDIEAYKMKISDYLSHADAKEYDFIFIAIDHAQSKVELINYISTQWKIPYIDVGISVSLNHNVAEADSSVAVRSDLVLPEDKECVFCYRDIDFNVDGYDSKLPNLQFKELNSLNADIAIIQFKQWAGFYKGLIEKNISFSIGYGNISKAYRKGACPACLRTREE